MIQTLSNYNWNSIQPVEYFVWHNPHRVASSIYHLGIQLSQNSSQQVHWPIEIVARNHFVKNLDVNLDWISEKTGTNSWKKHQGLKRPYSVYQRVIEYYPL